MKIKDIPQFIDSNCRYEIDVSWVFFEKFITGAGTQVELCPEFQRGHVWTLDQRISYIEYVLRGGRCSRDIIFSSEGFGGLATNPWYLVDGLQRVTTALQFLNDEVPAFGYKLSDYEDARTISRHQYSFHVRVVDTDLAGAMQLYLDLNSGGTPHAAEIERVRNLLKKTSKEMKLFPILKSIGREPPPRRTTVPWEMLEPHRKQAMQNHGQTLERLAERGGLSEIECLLILEDQYPRTGFNYKAVAKRIQNGDLDRLVEAWEAAK